MRDGAADGYPEYVGVGRTIEFILQSQARAEARLERAEARLERAEARLAQARADFDQRLKAIAKLMAAGMKMLVRVEKAHLELAAAQKQTDRKLQLFLDSLRQGRRRWPRPLNRPGTQGAAARSRKSSRRLAIARTPAGKAVSSASNSGVWSMAVMPRAGLATPSQNITPGICFK